MQNLDDYQNRIDKFQQRLEELAIEKELLLSRVFATKEKLDTIKESIEHAKSQTEIKLLKSMKAIENSI